MSEVTPVGWIAITVGILAILGGLIKLYNWIASFASKSEVSESHASVTATINTHRTESKELIEKSVQGLREDIRGVFGKIDSVLISTNAMGTRLAVVEAWQESHIQEDRDAHAVIGQVRDFMAVTKDRNDRVDQLTARVPVPVPIPVAPRRVAGARKKRRGDVPCERKAR